MNQIREDFWDKTNVMELVLEENMPHFFLAEKQETAISVAH